MGVAEGAVCAEVFGAVGERLPGRDQRLAKLVPSHLNYRELGGGAGRGGRVGSELQTTGQDLVGRVVVLGISRLASLQDVGSPQPRMATKVIGATREPRLVIPDEIVGRPGLTTEILGQPQHEEEDDGQPNPADHSHLLVRFAVRRQFRVWSSSTPGLRGW